jgi:hypothetical protein
MDRIYCIIALHIASILQKFQWCHFGHQRLWQCSKLRTFIMLMASLNQTKMSALCLKGCCEWIVFICFVWIPEASVPVLSCFISDICCLFVCVVDWNQLPIPKVLVHLKERPRTAAEVEQKLMFICLFLYVANRFKAVLLARQELWI